MQRYKEIEEVIERRILLKSDEGTTSSLDYKEGGHDHQWLQGNVKHKNDL